MLNDIISNLFNPSLFWDDEALYTLGSIVLGVSLLMTNILYFRLLHLFSSFFYLLYGIFLASISVIGTTIFLEAINVYGIALLLLEMREAHLPPELAKIYKKYSALIRPGKFKMMINRAKKTSFEENYPLIVKGDPVHQLMLILEGRADVILDDKLIASLEPGNFIGEFGLLTNSAASASVYSQEAVNIALWSKEEVDEIEELKLMIGANIAEKLQKRNSPSALRLFQSSSSYRKIISLSEERIFTEEVIIKEGQRVDQLFLIQEGKVEVEKKGRVVATLTTGSFLGEFSLIMRRNASASVRCRQSVKMACWKRELIEEIPELKQLVYSNIAQKIADVVAANETKGDKFLSENRELIERAATHTYSGERVANEGELLPQLMVALEGEAEILKGEKVVGLIQPGDFIGELPFLKGEPLRFSIQPLNRLKVALWKREEIVRDQALSHLLRERLAKKMIDIDSEEIAWEALNG